MKLIYPFLCVVFQMPPCLFDSTCMIQVKTRRFCSPCRLAKCFAVGMRKACIMGEFFANFPRMSFEVILFLKGDNYGVDLL